MIDADLKDLYQEIILDHSGRLNDVAFTGKGCAISIASASLMTEVLKDKDAGQLHRLVQTMQQLMKGETVDDTAIDPDDLERMVPLSGVAGFPMRVKCATLAWHTARAALDGPAPVKTG